MSEDINKNLIVNADDFGASTGVNAGIVECHVNGIVTSASLMVTGQAVEEAVAMSRDHPALAIGLHWDVWGEGELQIDLDNVQLVRDVFQRQLENFEQLMGRLPTHVDSHRHAHRRERLMPLFEHLVAPLGLPLRGNGVVRFVGAFYAQWEWGITNLDYVGIPFLQQMLREEVGEGWTEFSCHPGYLSPDYEALYLEERVDEVRTLTHPAVRGTIEELGIRLASYADFNLGRRVI